MEAEKNKISTGTLTYEDIHNKAEYEAGSMGINIDTSKDADKKEAGVTPNIGMPAEDKAESNTKATIAEGEIEIRNKDKQKQDLNRDIRNSLNKLGEIFDKESIQERQELAGLFGELAYKAVGDMAVKNGWEEGSAEKNALHALVGGIMSELSGSGFLSGASGAMVNEMIQDKLSDMFKDDPAMHQWASALIGGVVSEIVTGNAQAGASTAASGTKNNYLTHKQWNDYQRELANCNGDPDEEQKVHDKYEKLDALQNEIWLAKHQYDENINPVKIDNAVDIHGNEVWLYPGMVIEYSNPELEQAIKAVKDLESPVIELNDGSIFYVTDDGKAYQAFEGIQLGQAVVAGSRLAIDAEILPDPKTMTTDYVYGHIGIGLTKTLSTNVGYILDKAGNVYMFDQEQSGIGIASPIYAGYGKGTIETNWKHQEGNNIVNAIIGNSSGISVTSIVSASVSASEDSMIITVEIGVETSAGVSISRRHARKVGNIYER